MLTQIVKRLPADEFRYATESAHDRVARQIAHRQSHVPPSMPLRWTFISIVGIHPGIDEVKGQGFTNPTNDQSILRALTVTALTDGTASVFWEAVPGRSYRVEYKDSTADTGWTSVVGSVTAVNTTASLLDSTALSSATRFYRVVLLAP